MARTSVYADAPFRDLDGPPPPPNPGWSPVRKFGGYGAPGHVAGAMRPEGQAAVGGAPDNPLGCDCFVF